MEKKSVLDENSDFYTRHKDTVSKEELKKLPFKQKMSYFSDYYLKVVIAVVILVVLAIYILNATVFNRKEDVLDLTILNATMELQTDQLESDLRDVFELTSKNDLVSIASLSTSDVYSNMSFSTRMAAKNIDLVICDKESFESYAGQGAFQDLNDYFSGENARPEYTSLFVEAQENILDDDGNVISQDEAKPFAIDISDSEVFKSLNVGYDEAYLCVMYTNDHEENVRKTIDYIMTK